MKPKLNKKDQAGHWTLSRSEWEVLKTEIRALPDCGVPYAFCDEMICECRPQPEDLLKKFRFPKSSPCRAGIDFGVIGPNGKFRKCLHTVEAVEIDMT